MRSRRPAYQRPKPTWLDWAAVIVSVIVIYIIVGTIANMGSMYPHMRD